MNGRLKDNLSIALESRKSMTEKMRSERTKQFQLKAQERVKVKNSVLQSISKGGDVTLASIVLGKN